MRTARRQPGTRSASSGGRCGVGFPAWLGVLLALAVILAPGAGRLAAAEPERPGLEAYLTRLGFVAIPLELGEKHHLMLTGLLEGRRRTVVVDTGCSVTVVQERLAAKLRETNQQPAAVQDGVLGRYSHPDLVILKELRLGKVAFSNQPAHGLSLAKLGSTEIILGADFLLRHHALLDCQARRLYVRAASLSAPHREALTETLRRSGYHAAPLAARPSLVRTVSVRANDKPLQLLLDTGAPYTLLDNSVRRGMNLGRTYPSGLSMQGVDSLGPREVGSVDLRSLVLGDVVLADATVGLTELKEFRLAGELDGPAVAHGMLGLEWLSRLSALIDLGENTLWVCPPESTRKPR